MEEVKMITHKGKQLLRICFNDNVDDKKFIEIIEAAKAIISSQPPASVRLLTSFGNMTFNREMTKKFEEYVKFNTPYIYASAVLGITGLKRVLYNAYTIITKRLIKICETEEEAKEYLVST